MKLYFSPGACSMAVHIILLELGQVFELVKVDLGTKKTESGEDYLQINGKGYVPALALDNGMVMTEAAIILQYMADQNPNGHLAPDAGSMARYELMQWLHFSSTEIHKTLGTLFNPDISAEHRNYQVKLFNKRCGYLSQHLETTTFLMGDHFSIADAYLFTLLNWTNFVQVDMKSWPVITDYMARIASQPSVVQAMKEEGLLE